VNLFDRSSGVLIVDPVSAIANTLKRALVEAGFKKIYLANTVLEGLNTLSQQKVSWVITSLFPGQRFSAWHFLRLPFELEKFRQTSTSVLLSAEEQELIPSLYAMGMASFHLRPFTYNSFKAEVDRLEIQLQAQKKPALAFATALREKLQELEKIDDLERLEKGVYQWIDSSVEQKMRLIESQLQVGNNLEALLGIKQVLMQDPTQKAQLVDWGRKYLGMDDISDYKAKVSVNHAMIVDPDKSQLIFLSECLTELGTQEIKTFTDAEDACDYLKNNSSVDLVIGEWKHKGMEGRAFIQHVRHHGFADKPILIFSALVGEDAQTLIDEVGGVFLISKPSSKKTFQRQLSELFNRWRFPLEAEDIEQKISLALKVGDLDYARILMFEFEKNEKIEISRKKFLQALFAFHQGQYGEAKQLILEHAKIKLPGHKEIGLLGKVMLKLGEFADAQKCLEQVNAMVPGNIERLCDLADIAAELRQEQKIMNYMDEARKIGGDTGLVMSAHARHATALGQTDEARRFLEDEEVARSMVAYMNNLGVTYAFSGKWKESIDAYVKAIKTLGDLHNELQGIVYYNLGLTLVRQQRYKDAIPVLKNAQKKADDTVARKAGHLLTRVIAAVENNVPVVLKEAAREIDLQVSKIAPINALDKYIDTLATRPKPGEFGLFGVFQPMLQPELDLISEFPKIMGKTA
jgi:CheY-like chemotaxis protein